MLTKEQIKKVHKLLPKDVFNQVMIDEGHPEEVCNCKVDDGRSAFQCWQLTSMYSATLWDHWCEDGNNKSSKDEHP